MKSYNARLVKTKDPRFSEWGIVLKTGAPLHKSVRLSWIEEIDEDADESERNWYQYALDHNMEKNNG